MNVKNLITPSSKLTNPFKEGISSEVWEDLKKKGKPVNKKEILEALRGIKSEK
jgi:hypothetical protein